MSDDLKKFYYYIIPGVVLLFTIVGLFLPKIIGMLYGVLGSEEVSAILTFYFLIGGTAILTYFNHIHDELS